MKFAPCPECGKRTLNNGGFYVHIHPLGNKCKDGRKNKK